MQIWDCNGGTNQQWTFNGNGTISSVRFPDLCLDVNGAATANGTRRHRLDLPRRRQPTLGPSLTPAPEAPVRCSSDRWPLPAAERTGANPLA